MKNHNCKVLGGYRGYFGHENLPTGIEVKIIKHDIHGKWQLWSFDESIGGLNANRYIPIAFCPFCGQKL